MDELLRTERLLLRRLRMEDADALAAIVCDPVTMSHYPRAFTREEVETWIVKNLDRYRDLGFGLWAMERRDDGLFVGECGLVPQQVEGETEIEIGWHVHRSLWRRGYATEAARACLDLAFDCFELARVVSLVLPANVASQGVARKIGMVPERLVLHAGLPHLLFARGPGAPGDPVERTRVAYERIAGRYAREDARHPHVTARARRILAERVPRPAVVVDLGCGTGRDAAALQESGFEVVALDLSERMARLAARRVPRALVADLRRLPFRPASVDAAWASASLHHLPKVEIPNALAGLVRLLRPHGCLYLAVKEGRGEAWRPRLGEPRFFSFYRGGELDEVLAGAGFAVVEAWTEPDARGREPWLNRIAQAASTSCSASSRSGTRR